MPTLTELGKGQAGKAGGLRLSTLHETAPTPVPELPEDLSDL